MTTKSRRKHSAAPFVVWRRNSTDTNRGRLAVIAESDVLFESAYEPNDRPDNARISFTVRDRETGTRYKFSAALVEWKRLVVRIDDHLVRAAVRDDEARKAAAK